MSHPWTGSQSHQNLVMLQRLLLPLVPSTPYQRPSPPTLPTASPMSAAMSGVQPTPQSLHLLESCNALCNKDPSNVHMKVLVQWLNGEATWNRLDALCLQNPMVTIQYVHAKRLLNHAHFSWVKEYEDSGEILHTLKTTTSNNASTKRFKFGLQVPNSVCPPTPGQMERQLWLARSNQKGNGFYQRLSDVLTPTQVRDH